jgi:hypothetical protein
MLSTNITKLIAEAMKKRDAVRLSTLRLLSSAFNYERIEKQHELTDEEELVVIRKQAKQRKDSIEALQQAQGKHTTSSESEIEVRLNQEEEELKILQEFLPPEMDEAELEKIVNEAVETIKPTGMADMGKVIGLVKSKVGDGVEGGKIAEMVKSKLNG